MKPTSKSAAESRPARIEQICITVGSIGLIAATATDTLAVIGRHTGIALLGSIEMVQVAIALLATAAMVFTTKVNEHASVHILTDRLARPRAAILKRIAAFISGLFCLLLLIGSIWVLQDTWPGHERSELLHIPLGVFRILLIVALALISGLFFYRSLRGAQV